jgi:hypothetical protein
MIISVARIRNLTLTEPVNSGIVQTRSNPILRQARLVRRSRLVFTGDSEGSNPRLWSGHPEAIQIVAVEKIPEHSVTHQGSGLSTNVFIENIRVLRGSRRFAR